MPFCTCAEAARWLDIPERTVRNGFEGANGGEPVLLRSDSSQHFLSLADLTEAWTLDVIRRGHRVTTASARKALIWLRAQTKSTHPLASVPILTDGESLLVHAFGELANSLRHGQLEWRAIVEPCLRRVERGEDGVVTRLFPATREDEAWDERPVMIDPRIGFGRPTLAGTGIPTAAIFDRWVAGESPAELALDFGLRPEQIDHALRFEARQERRPAA